MKRFNLTVLPLFLITLLGLVGCAARDLAIVDSAGAPIEGAKIVGTSMSIGGQTTYSDKNGYANIPNAVQETQWISVYKQGYRDVEHIAVAQKKPIIVKMIKAKK